MISMAKPAIGVALSLCATLLSAQSAKAHDFFLLPDKTIAPAAELRIKATIGSQFPKAEIAITSDRTENLVVRGQGSPKLSVVSADADGLALRVDGAAAGTVVAAVSMKARDVDYGEDRIPLILEEYRIAPAAVASIERGRKPRTLRVVSRRMAKTIVCAATCDGMQTAVAPMGEGFEFVAADATGTRYRLMMNGRPLGSYPVDLADATGKRIKITTDANGEIAAPPAGAGLHMLFAAHMTLPKDQERYSLDLTSLTVERR